ncbi:hypothetical protein K450DRAFT_227301 [Umbelopsis ramanniana AG]|uniref:SANT domain-containing protein n=1 Tax=Umbelopsis ramanniana AG TaxID=1314678 RepID=A0AAD5HFI3_UMBRA|nr:uncharacterized protein K450DRAFT_227301 [Umbelopsis ramanniana AG]KAI8582467.1 hypothetical protein K450DRAFT_227301 [Umbelopsis ramanniana AG]
MSVSGSNSSRGSPQRSRSQSRSPPPFADGRYPPPPPRHGSRYEPYGGYRSMRPMDDYRDIRDRERERDRAMMIRDDRYPPRGRERYMGYYRDDIGPPPPHQYSGPPPPIRRESGNIERPKLDSRPTTPTAREDVGRFGPPGPPDGYRSPRYMDWRDRNRERDRDRERDRRFREDERRRDLDRRDRSRDGYPRYEPPLPPFPPDSYRDRERDRERELSTPGGYGHYHDRERSEDPHFYRPPPRARSPPDFDRFRGRPPSWGPPGGPPGYGSSRRETSRGREKDDPRSPRAASTSVIHPRPRDREDSFSDRRREPGPPLKASDAFPPPRRASPSPSTSSRWDSDKPVKSTEAEKEESPELEKISEDVKSVEPETSTVSAANVNADEAEPKAEASTALPILEFARPERRSTTPPPVKQLSDDLKETTIDSKEEMDVDTKPSTEEEHPVVEYVVVKDEATVDASRKLSEVSTTMEDIASTEDAKVPESDAVAITDLFERPKSPSPIAAEAVEEDPIPVKSEDEVNAGFNKLMETSEENEDAAPKVEEELTEQSIVERIDQIENDITVFEELLEKRVNKDRAASNKVLHASEAAALMRNAVQAEEEVFVDVLNDVASQQQSESQPGQDAASKPALVVYDAPPEPSPAARKSLRAQIEHYHNEDEDEEPLYKKLYEENRKIAKANSHLIGGWQGKPDSEDDWSDEENWSKPMFANIESYPSYKANVESFSKMRHVVVTHMATRRRKLKMKEARLKKRYKAIHDRWKTKNIELDRMRDQERRASERGSYKGSSYRKRTEDETEGAVDGIDFDSPFDALRFGPEGPSTPYGAPHRQGPWASDTVRSEAELLEIIQSLESADMRNPELRAAKTTANIPPMILDLKERAQTFDDRSGLVEDPITYYHTGKDTGDVWTKQETSTFLESYMLYPKQFGKIAAAIESKTACQSVLLYYRMKKTIDFKGLVAASLKGKRSRSGKKKDRLAAAVRAATSGSTRGGGRGKNKGSALLADIGLAQDTRKAKEKERKNKELRELEEAGGYWDKLGDRRRTRTREKPPRTPTGYVSESQATDKRRGIGKRKGKSPKSGVEDDPRRPRGELEMDDDEEDDSFDTPKDVTTAKWTATERDAAVEAFKIHGRNFMQVSEIVGTKTEDQCRNLYHNYKRKYGPNAFNEESGRSNMAAEEEDAAAALVGMYQMGAQSPQGDQLDSGASTPRKPGRRPRTASVNPINDELVESDQDYMAMKSRKGPKGTITPDLLAGKRPAYSSYWSVSEKADFIKFLEMFGRDWDRLADAMKSKTATQVRNFFQNNLEKMQLDKIIMRFDRRQQQQSPTASHHHGTPPQPPSQPQPKQPSIPPQHHIPPSDRMPHDSQYSPIPPYGFSPGHMSGPPPPPPGHYGPRQGYFPPPSEGHRPPMSSSPTASQSYPSSYQPYRMHSPPRSAFVRSYASPPQPPMPLPPTQPKSDKEPTTVTKVADLLNNDDSAETSQPGNWESWFN